MYTVAMLLALGTAQETTGWCGPVVSCPSRCVSYCCPSPCVSYCCPSPCVSYCCPTPCVSYCCPTPCVSYCCPTPCVSYCCTPCYRPCVVVSPCPPMKIMPAKPEKKMEEEKKKKGPPPEGEASLEPAPAILMVSLPADATLTIDGGATRSTSAERSFITPPLDPGKVFDYVLVAEVVRDGKTLTTSRKVTVRGGQETRVTLEIPADTLAAR